MVKKDMKAEGAIVFLIAFMIFLVATLAYTGLPIGNSISDAMDTDPTFE